MKKNRFGLKEMEINKQKTITQSKIPIRFGFLFLSHKAHIHHSAPVAFELSTYQNFSVYIYVTTQENLEIVNKISKLYPNHNCTIKQLKPSAFYSITRKFKSKIYPGINHIINRHYKEISTFDGLLSPHYNLRQIHEKAKGSIKYFMQLHGAGDFKYGYSPKMKMFDYLLVPGKEIKSRLIEEKICKTEKIRVVGYPKFDIVENKKISKRNFFNNNNVTIQYCPHYGDTTSWEQWGYYILDFFTKHKEYNLIFSPHIKLFGMKVTQKLLEYNSFENILIDTKSDYLIDMTYTKIADIYLGDVSSQVYEFIYKPRPCIFLNPDHIHWKNDNMFNMWKLGDVITDFSALKDTIENCIQRHNLYIDAQKNIFSSKFDNIGEIAGKKAAKVISDIMQSIMLK